MAAAVNSTSRYVLGVYFSHHQKINYLMNSFSLDAICEKLPSPTELSDKKVERLMFSRARHFSALPEESQDLKKFFLQCSSDENSPVIIFVSKMFATEYKSLPENRPKVLTPEEIAARRDMARKRALENYSNTTTAVDGYLEEPLADDSKDSNDNHVPPPLPDTRDVFIAFARVYSGTLRKGCKLYILGPRYDPVEVKLYILTILTHFV